jgi:hypothetical protein
VCPEPIEYHHLPFRKRGCKEVLNVGFEGLRVCGSFYPHRLSHGSFQSDRGDEGSVLALRFFGTLP